MHELSIALSILDLVAEEVRARNLTAVLAIHVRVGPLSGVVGDTLCSAYDLVREGTELADTRLVIDESPLIVYCPACDREQSAVSPQELRCHECNALTPRVVRGHELEIAALEIEK
jgi:hydrogenase nickel incorporation protein HypA/HybF